MYIIFSDRILKASCTERGEEKQGGIAVKRKKTVAAKNLGWRNKRDGGKAKNGAPPRKRASINELCLGFCEESGRGEEGASPEHPEALRRKDLKVTVKKRSLTGRFSTRL